VGFGDMRVDGIFIQLGPLNIEWELWETYCAYDATEDGQTVFIREQRRKFLPKKRRVITRPANYSRR